MISRRNLSAAALAALLPVPLARAQENWPAARAIEVVVPYPPAGGIDLMARLAAKYLPTYLEKAQFVVTNRPGAGGQTGNEFVFTARPDGFTLGAIASLSLSSIPLERPVRWKLEDFTYIANLVDDPGAFWVRADSPIKDLADLRRRAAAEAEAVSFGTAAGVGSDDHQLLLAFEEAAGVKAQRGPQPAAGGADALPGPGGAHALEAHGRGADLPRAGPRRGRRLDARLRRAAGRKINLPLRPVFGDDYRKSVLHEQEVVKGLFARRPWGQG